jgi:DNA invertase Pin-like site-specific DNA recombinase
MAYQWVHVGDYEDAAISGRYMAKRAGLQHMLRDIRTRSVEVDLILLDTSERLARSEELGALLWELRDEHGVLVLTAESGFTDPLSEAGQALQFAESMRAVRETHVKAHQVRRGKKDVVKLQRWPGGGPPLGYRLRRLVDNDDPDNPEVYSVLEADPATATLVQEMFRLAHDSGWGSSRIAKHFNSQAEQVAKLGQLADSTIWRLLQNEIYTGVMVWGKNATDVVRDSRIARPVPESEWVREEGFCEPLITKEIFEAVRNDQLVRGASIRCARAAKQANSAKQIKPLVPGMTLKHWTAGLARCGVCGSSMRVCSSKASNGKRYSYVRCPRHASGSCSNGIYVPASWLRQAIVSVVRCHLFPPPGQGRASSEAEVPVWFPALVDEVQLFWSELCRADQDQHPRLAKELDDLNRKIIGWTQSVSKPDLSGQVRLLLEQQLDGALARKAEIERELAAQDSKDEQLARLLDPQAVLDRLHRLDQVLATANPTAINAELSLHIDRVEAYPDGRVVMFTCKLGLFEGVEALLARPDGDAAEGPEAGSIGNQTAVPRIRPRRRGKLRVDRSQTSDTRPGHVTRDIQDPQRFAGLEPNWFWKDTLQCPWRRCWAKDHADEVLRTWTEQRMSLTELADRFGKSIPTIRHALKIAREQNGSN